jgi:hypothetical protein
MAELIDDRKVRSWLTDAERGNGPGNCRIASLATKLLEARAENERFRKALLDVCAEGDWCPVCDHHPSSGHYSCPLETEEEP